MEENGQATFPFTVAASPAEFRQQPDGETVKYHGWRQHLKYAPEID